MLVVKNELGEEEKKVIYRGEDVYVQYYDEDDQLCEIAIQEDRAGENLIVYSNEIRPSIYPLFTEDYSNKISHEELSEDIKEDYYINTIIKNIPINADIQVTVTLKTV